MSQATYQPDGLPRAARHAGFARFASGKGSNEEDNSKQRKQNNADRGQRRQPHQGRVACCVPRQPEHEERQQRDAHHDEHQGDDAEGTGWHAEQFGMRGGGHAACRGGGGVADRMEPIRHELIEMGRQPKETCVRTKEQSLALASFVVGHADQVQARWIHDPWVMADAEVADGGKGDDQTHPVA